jgi:serine/threonine protein kinase
MDEVGDAIEEYMFKIKPTYRFSFLPAIKLGGQMIELVKKLHSFNIVHGDVHLGNFAFRSPDSFTDIIFLDFGRAHFVGPKDVEKDLPKQTGSVDFCEERKRIYHFLASKWEMMGCKPTYRDDVYRAVKMMGFAMWGGPFQHKLESLIRDSDNRALYVKIMHEADFFTTNAFRFYLGPPMIPSQYSHDVAGLLGKISHLASHENPENPHEKPNYKAILDHLKEIIIKLEGIRFDDPNIFQLSLAPVKRH